MRIYIDADGCPVVDSTLRLAAAHRVETVILCDTSHEIQRPGVQTVTVSKGADSVDFALVNRLAPGDVVITQDYGLAAMCLAKRAKVLHQDGMRYSPDISLYCGFASRVKGKRRNSSFTTSHIR